MGIQYLDGLVRRNIKGYFFLRRLAVLVCRVFPLEDGFEILKYVSPVDSDFPALDIGSNDGTSIQIMRHFIPNIKIVAFDPVIEPRVKPYGLTFWNVGVSSKKTKTKIFVPRIRGQLLSQYSSIDRLNVFSEISKDFGINQGDVTLEERTIETIAIDSLDLEPFFIKIDIEGHELEALKGMRQTITKFRPIVLSEVSTQMAWDQIDAWLNSVGYSCRARSRSYNFEDMQFNQKTRNYLWLPNDQSTTWQFKNQLSF